MSFEAHETALVETEAEAREEIIQSFAALELRFTLVQDQMRAAAAKVNLLAGMGLDRTEGYAEAYATYEARLADFNALRARLGL
jgi:hypothetical protein